MENPLDLYEDYQEAFFSLDFEEMIPDIEKYNIDLNIVVDQIIDREQYDNENVYYQFMANAYDYIIKRNPLAAERLTIDDQFLAGELRRWKKEYEVRHDYPRVISIIPEDIEYLQILYKGPREDFNKFKDEVVLIINNINKYDELITEKKQLEKRLKRITNQLSSL